MTALRRPRREVRPAGDARQRALVEAFERLLTTKPMAEIGIDEVTAGAGLSRSAFYFYFASKQAVLLELLDRMVAEIDARLAALGAPGDDPGEWWRAAIGVFADVFGAHRAVAITLAEAQATVPEVREEWARRSTRWIDATAEAIAAEQRRGRARRALNPRSTAIALTAMNERVLATAFAGRQPALHPSEAVQVLADVWTTTIHGGAAAV